MKNPELSTRTHSAVVFLALKGLPDVAELVSDLRVEIESLEDRLDVLRMLHRANLEAHSD